MQVKVVHSPESVVSRPEDIDEILARYVSRDIDVKDEINQEQKITTK